MKRDHTQTRAHRLAACMRWIAALALGLASPSLASAAQEPGAIVSHPSLLITHPLRPFLPPSPIALTLECGAQLLVLEHNELPLVDGTFIFRAEHTDVLKGQAGISTLLADVLREGGSQRTTGTELDDWLDSHAASLTILSTADALRIEFSCVKADLGNVLVFIGELLMIPAYPLEQLERSRLRELTRLAQESEDIAGLADHQLDRLTLGATSPLARQATHESVSALSRQDLLDHHRRIIGIDRLLVGATGAVDPNSLAARLDSLLLHLPRAAKRRPQSAQTFRLPGRTTIYLQDRPGLTHCEVRIAGPGVRRLDGDFVPLDLWSRATGTGGSAGRSRIRLSSEPALVLEGRLGFRPDWNHNGRLLGSFRVRNDSLAEVLAALFELMQGAKLPLEADLLAAVRRRILNGEVFQIDSPQERLQRALDLELHSYPADFWARRDASLRNLTPEQVAAAVERHLDADRLTVLVVGPADELQEALAALGTLIRLPAQ